RGAQLQRAPTLAPPQGGIISQPTRTLWRVAEQSLAQSGRPYPPPPASESILPAQATVLAAIGLQLLLPERLTVGPTWLLPGLEGALLIGLTMATPRELEREHTRRRALALSLTAFVSAANVFSLYELTHRLLHHNVNKGRELIISGM